MANTKVQSEQIEDGSITADKLADGTIVAAELADNAVVTAAINADAVTGAKIADDAIDSEHYTDGSIDTAHIADAQITVAKMAANSVDSDQYVDGSIDTVHLGDLQVTTAKIANGNISTAKIADNAVTSAKIDTNIDIAGTFDVTGATTLDSTLAVAGATTLTTAAAAAEMLNIVSTHASGIPILTLKGAHSAQVRYQDENGNNQARIDFNDAGQFNFLDATDGTSHLFIKNDGNVGIGTTSPFGQTQISDTDWSSGAPYGTVLTVTGNNTNDANWGHLMISDSSTGTGNGGMIRFATGSTSSDMNPFAGIDSFTEGSAYGGLKFLTRPNGGTATARMTILSDGNVGIGTDSPSEKLDVNGNIKIPTTSYIDIGSAGGNNTLYLGKTSSSSGSIARQLQIRGRYSSGDRTLTLTAGGSTTHAIIDASNDLILQSSSGNVGIGTTTTDPYSLGSTGKTLSINSSNASTGSLISLESADTNRGYLFGNSSNVVLSAVPAIPLVFKTTDTERMKINASGSVGVMNDQTGLSSGTYDMTWGGGSKAHGSHISPYMTLSTRYGTWDANIGCNARSNIGQTSGGTEQATSYGGGGASNLYVGFTTLNWYHWSSSVTNTLGTNLPISSAYQMMVADSGGNLNINGTYYNNASDRRLKDNITPISSALDKVKKLTGNTFTWKTDDSLPIPEQYAGKTDVGVIAQEVQEVVPEAVGLSPWDIEYKEIDNPDYVADAEPPIPQKIQSKDVSSESGNDYLTVNEEKLVPLLIEAIKEQQEQIEQLKTEIEALKS